MSSNSNELFSEILKSIGLLWKRCGVPGDRDTASALADYLVSNSGNAIVDPDPEISLAEELEDRFLATLFVIPPERMKPVYHYTSMQSALRMLDDGRLRMSSIVGMNDRSEIDFGSASIKGRGIQRYHHKVIESANRRYIHSCSLRGDDLNQWRLYGDDGRGLCLCWVPEPSGNSAINFAAGKVYYGNNFKKAFEAFLSDCLRLLGVRLVFLRLLFWRNFMKDGVFRDEREFRFLFVANGIAGEPSPEWYLTSGGIINRAVSFDLNNLPFRLRSIKIGPKVHDQLLNQSQFKYLLRTMTPRIDVLISDITCYR